MKEGYYRSLDCSSCKACNFTLIKHCYWVGAVPKPCDSRTPAPDAETFDLEMELAQLGARGNDMVGNGLDYGVLYYASPYSPSPKQTPNKA